MQAINFEEVLDRILEKDSRYHRDAYFFLRESLDHTQRQARKGSKDELRHVSGRELLEGIRDYALDQFGPMALTVLEEWGVRRCEDFGEIVFNMVDWKLLAKTDTDSRADFQGAYDFTEAFRRPFLPSSKLAAPQLETPRPAVSDSNPAEA